MNMQLRLFDNIPVESFKAKFGQVDIDDDDAGEFLADSELIIVIKANVAGAGLKRLPSGDWQRTNSCDITSMRVVTGAMRNQLVEFYGFDDQLVLPSEGENWGGGAEFTDEALAERDAGDVDVDTPLGTTQIETGELPAMPRDPALAAFFAEGRG